MLRKNNSQLSFTANLSESALKITRLVPHMIINGVGRKIITLWWTQNTKKTNGRYEQFHERELTTWLVKWMQVSSMIQNQMGLFLQSSW